MIGMLQLFSCNLYYLLNPRSSLSNVTPYMTVCFSFDPEVVLDLFSISTLIDDSIFSKRIDRGYVVSVGSKQTLVDLFELDMVDFDIIFGKS